VIREALAAVRAEGRIALLPFMTAGLPDPARSVDLFKAMAAAGADLFEVGIPYSDPLMDGPVIQRGSEAALRAGMTMRRSFDLIAAIAKATGRPLLAMTYANPVMRLGPGEFCRRLAAAGAAGVIVPDLPLEESGPLREAARDAGVGVVAFVAPTSNDARIQAVAKADPVFIYGVADLGVTGERAAPSSHALELSHRVRRLTRLPLVLGVGISTPEQAASVKGACDGVIVGSALVRCVLDAPSPRVAARSIAEQVARLRAALV
jgi:tryptophan synthase alpha chain